MKTTINYFKLLSLLTIIIFSIGGYSFQPNRKNSINVEANKNTSHVIKKINVEDISIETSTSETREGSTKIPFRDSEVLKAAARDFLSLLNGYFVIPNEVEFLIDGSQLRYEEGFIFSNYPYSKDFNFGTLKKSAEESNAIHLHELTHQVFENTIMYLYGKESETFLGFFTRDDEPYRTQTLTVIESMKKADKKFFQGKEAEIILDHFYEISNLSDAYNELFADLVPAFFKDDPKAILKSVYFEKLEDPAYVKMLLNKQTSPEDTDTVQFEIDLHKALILRSFEKITPPSEATQNLKYRDGYTKFFETRSWIWENIYNKYFKLQNPNMPKGEILFKIFKSFIASLTAVTQNFKKTGKGIDIQTLNQDLQRKLSEEFQLTK